MLYFLFKRIEDNAGYSSHGLRKFHCKRRQNSGLFGKGFTICPDKVDIGIYSRHRLDHVEVFARHLGLQEVSEDVYPFSFEKKKKKKTTLTWMGEFR